MMAAAIQHYAKATILINGIVFIEAPFISLTGVTLQ